MVDREESNKRALKFLLGYVVATLSVSGWVVSSLLSPNKLIWFLSIPLILFMSIVQTLMIIAYVYQK